MSGPNSPHDDFTDGVRRRYARMKRAREEGEPSMGGQLAQIGVLGWIIVTPALAGLFAGRWIDRHSGFTLLWSATLMGLGIALGFWTAWKWMQRQ